MTKREIAERASRPDGVKLAANAFRIRPVDMADLTSMYVVEPEHEGVCKIGIASNPFERLRGLQTASWRRLKIKALFWFKRWGDAASLEYDALQFAKEQGLRLQGEWLDLDHMESIGLMLSTPGADKRKFTDNHGLVHDWFPEIQRQKLAEEDEYYARSPGRASRTA